MMPLRIITTLNLGNIVTNLSDSVKEKSPENGGFSLLLSK